MKAIILVCLTLAAHLWAAPLQAADPAPLGPGLAHLSPHCISRQNYNMIDWPITCSHEEGLTTKSLQFTATIRELRRAGWNLTPEINGFDSKHELFTFVFQN